jgi:hypothetical protein
MIYHNYIFTQKDWRYKTGFLIKIEIHFTKFIIFTKNKSNRQIMGVAIG